MNEQVSSCIRKIGEDLIALSDAILLAETPAPTEQTAPTEQPVEAEKTKKSRKKKSDKEQVEATVTQAAVEPEPVTHEKLREFLGNLAAGGHSDDVAALLKEYGSGKLSTVPEENYPALYAAAKGIGDADA